jgi:hypothetical protein
LVNGSATINIPAETIGAGQYYGIPSVNYTPDGVSSTVYAQSSGSALLTVNSIAPTVAITLASNTFATTDPLAVTVTVDGGSGNPIPVGAINFFGGGYNGNANLINGSATFTIPGSTLTAGVDTLQATYDPGPQGPSQGVYIYSNAIALTTVGVTVGSKLPPTVAVSEVGYDFSITQPVPVTASVSGMSGMPIPTGTMIFSSGSYTSAAVPLINGAAVINIPARTLASATDTITATYTPDAGGSSRYATSSGKTEVYINYLNSTTIMSLSASTITPDQPLTVTATVSGPSGNPNPTGSVTLSSGSYAATLPLAGGSAAFTISAGSLPIGNDTLVSSYTPDATSANIYNPSSQYGTVTVAAPAPAFTVAGTAVTVKAGATTGNTSTVTITPTSAFAGNIYVGMTASITSSPAGALYPSSIGFGATSPVTMTSAGPGTATLTITTLATTTTQCTAANHPPDGIPWYAKGGAVLACVLMIGVAPKRRKGLTMLGALMLLIALTGGVLACGGGGGGGTGCVPTTTPGTTPGSYTITVTATSGTATATSTVALTVN